MEIVTRIRGGGVDDYGDPIGAAAEKALLARAVAPRFTADPVDPSRRVILDGFTVYLEPGSEVVGSDLLRVRGGVYEVDGEPGDWRSPWDNASRGVEVNVRRGRG